MYRRSLTVVMQATVYKEEELANGRWIGLEDVTKGAQMIARPLHNQGPQVFLWVTGGLFGSDEGGRDA